MNESIWKSGLRSLFKTFSALLGIFFAVLAMVYLTSLIEKTSDEDIPNDYSLEILPDAQGVRKKRGNRTPVILQIDIEGIIGGVDLTQKKVENILVESQENTLKDNRVKAIFLHINSPGGTITDADGIYRALTAYKKKHNIPVIAYVDGLAASGGYYVALAADEIIATDVSLIGSVGVVISSFINVSDLMEKIGVKALTISQGEGKDAMDPLRPWKSGEDKNFQELTQYYYAQFVDHVVKNRPHMSKEALIKEYGAHIFAAVDAKNKGFIDENGLSRNQVLEKLLAKMGIQDDQYQVVRLTSTHWLSQLLNVQTKSPLLTGKIIHEISTPLALPQELLGKPLFLYQP